MSVSLTPVPETGCCGSLRMPPHTPRSFSWRETGRWALGVCKDPNVEKPSSENELVTLFLRSELTFLISAFV